MAWKIDLGDALYDFDPCYGCPEAFTVPATRIEPAFETCPHNRLNDIPCAWDSRVGKVNAFIERANAELAEILR